jgi:hypothetical protein
MKVHVAVLAVALMFVAAVTGYGAPADKDVRVINTPAEAVPVAVQGTANVNVTNTPTVTLAAGAKVSIASDAAQPFQVSANSTQVGNNVSTVTIATVPAGKRLVIEWVSMTGQVPPTQHAEIMEISTIAGPFGGASHQFVIEEQPDAVIGDALFRSNQSLRLYADPGTQVSALFRRNSGAGLATWNATISGYLVDVP